jgi:hypothetical protein
MTQERAAYKLERAVLPFYIYLHETLIRVVEVPREPPMSALSVAPRVMSSDCVPPTHPGQCDLAFGHGRAFAPAGSHSRRR